ncbi:MAG: hypothetical protein K0U59_12475 [Gammaproteobacteria bacterium]|nr:hypothetical protein [Gammaproteobacteria bacterium]
MLTLSCKLFQRIQLGGIFTITPVYMEDGTVQLEILACDGGELTRVEPPLPKLDNVWLQQADKQKRNKKNKEKQQKD